MTEGLVWTTHFAPVHVSMNASGWKLVALALVDPAAQQRLALRHVTELRMAPTSPAGVALGTSTHFAPFQCSIRLGPDVPLLLVVVPEIQQFEARGRR